jgi:cytochrome c-type protein NapC
MEAHLSDILDEGSLSLAARHSQNPWFGHKSCYTCHANYGMYGYPLTKLNGMLHVWHYYTSGYLDVTTDEALGRLHLYKPFKNANCFQCHSGQLRHFTEVPDHGALAGELSREEVSCVGSGCHGYAHPFSKASKRDSSALDAQLLDPAELPGAKP